MMTELGRERPATLACRAGENTRRRLVQAIFAISLLLLGSAASLAQVQRVKLIPPDVEYEDNFGYAVAIDGDWALIGSPLDDDLAAQSGAVYVYKRGGGMWTLMQKLKANDATPSANFGDKIAVDGIYAVVGAFLDRPLGIYSAGSAYVFERVGETWVERAKLWASDASPEANFGDAVDISSSVIAVGASNATGVGAFSGKAYVFEGGGGSWSQTATLIPTDAAQGDGFGASVSVDGADLMVGASNANLPTGGNQGVAYHFVSPSLGVWVETQKLSGPGTLNDYFGFDLDLQGDHLLISAPGGDAAGSNSGAVHYYQRNAGVWSHVQVVAGIDTRSNDAFGAWVAIDDGVGLMSGQSTSDTAPQSGGGYAFSLLGAQWHQDGKLLPQDSEPHHLVGLAVALSGRTAILGCPFDNSACPQDPNCHSGAAYIFELTTNARQYGSCASNAPCGNLDTHGGCRNKTGHGSTLQASGNTSYSADDLFLQMRELPPHSSHRLYMGPQQMTAPFGNGQRLVAPGAVGYFRYPVMQASAQGYSSFGPGIIAHSQGFNGAGTILPGQTWHFQGWHRDIGGPCGQFFNLTNGLSVTFAP